MQVEAFFSFTIAVLLLLAGKIVTMNVVLLRKYSIPEPVVGGLLCTAAVAAVYAISGRKIVFDLGSVDGFDQGEPRCERDDGCEVALRLLAS